MERSVQGREDPGPKGPWTAGPLGPQIKPLTEKGLGQKVLGLHNRSLDQFFSAILIPFDLKISNSLK